MAQTDIAAMHLSASEVRILGVLIEKELATPEYYPMTVNAVTTGCNQKTNRLPVVSYTEAEVEADIEQLQRKRLVGMASGTHHRAPKYRHALTEQLGLGRDALAVLCLLMLRGVQTVGELRGRSGRLFEFASLEAVEETLSALAAREDPCVAVRPPRPGQKEERWVHLLGGTPEADDDRPYAGGAADERLAVLEEQVHALLQRVESLESELAAFRSQFE